MPSILNTAQNTKPTQRNDRSDASRSICRLARITSFRSLSFIVSTPAVSLLSIVHRIGLDSLLHGLGNHTVASTGTVDDVVMLCVVIINHTGRQGMLTTSQLLRRFQP